MHSFDNKEFTEIASHTPSQLKPHPACTGTAYSLIQSSSEVTNPVHLQYSTFYGTSVLAIQNQLLHKKYRPGFSCKSRDSLSSIQTEYFRGCSVTVRCIPWNIQGRVCGQCRQEGGLQCLTVSVKPKSTEWWWLGSAMVGRWTCDREVMGLNPGIKWLVLVCRQVDHFGIT